MDASIRYALEAAEEQLTDVYEELLGGDNAERCGGCGECRWCGVGGTLDLVREALADDKEVQG